MSTDDEKTLCLKNATRIALAHVAPPQLEAATADIARELEKARAAAVKSRFKVLEAFDEETFKGASRCLKHAGMRAAAMGDSTSMMGLLGIDILLAVIQAEIYPKPAPAAPAPAPAATPPQGAVAP